MNSLISQDQTTFIMNRAIQDNIIIAYEIFHYIKTSPSKSHAMTIKLDMHKADDKIE